MKKQSWACILGILLFALVEAWAQDNATPPPADSAAQSQEPVPAYGQQSGVTPISENPPISGLDQPGLEPHAAPLSYLQPGGTLSESADSNVENTVGGSSVRSISRGIGSLELQRLWSHYDTAVQYMGGAAYYDLRGVGWKVLQQLDVDQKITWKRGQLSLRDSFSYLPEGNFGASYGAEGSEGITPLGGSSFGSFWGGSGLGTLGLVPRVMNVGLVDIQENLTPKSAVTAAAGYGLVHFYGTDPNTGIHYLDNTQLSGQLAYDRILTPRTQVAVMYGYQAFDFSSIGTSFHSNVIELMYGHRISGRMDFVIGAGPQLTKIQLACGLQFLGNPHCSGLNNAVGTIPDFRIGVAGQARLRYRFPKTSLTLSYERFITAGSGFFAGAQSDIARFKVERPLSRVWTGFTDIGYARNSRELPLTAAQLATCVPPGSTPGPGQTVCPGVDARTYAYGFAGLGLHRKFGRNFNGFVSYQFNELTFDNSYCGGTTVCSRIANRHVGTIGMDWTPRPIRLD